MSTDGQRTKWRRNVAEKYNRLSTAHQRYRQTDKRTDGRTMTHSERERRSLKMIARDWWRTIFKLKFEPLNFNFVIKPTNLAVLH